MSDDPVLYNKKAEEAVLGSCLLDGTAAPLKVGSLDADDFYLPARFATAREILEAQTDVDGVYEAIGVHYTIFSPDPDGPDNLCTGFPLDCQFRRIIQRIWSCRHPAL